MSLRLRQYVDSSSTAIIAELGGITFLEIEEIDVGMPSSRNSILERVLVSVLEVSWADFEKLSC
jgi:hypothetical protein